MGAVVPAPAVLPVGHSADQCCGVHSTPALADSLPLLLLPVILPFPVPFLVTFQEWMNLPESPCVVTLASLRSGPLVLL